jgi:hypothetical protein
LSPEEFDQQLHDTEVKLARLRALYEQFFQGIEKMEPHVPRKDMERTLDALRRNLPRNTALRFRMQQLVARYGTYVTYWQRIARQIEEGTYKRDIIRAQRAKTAPVHHQGDASAWEIEVDVDAIEEADLGHGAFDDSDVDAILGALKPMSSAPRGRSIGTERPATSATAAPPPAAPGTPVPAARPAPPGRTGLTAFGPGRGIVRPGGSVVAPLPAGAVIAPPPRAPTPPAPSAARAAPVPTPAVAAPSPPAPSPPRPAMVMPRPAGIAPPTATPAPPVVRPAPAVPRPAPAAPSPAPTHGGRAVVTGGGVDVAAMRALYDRYADARRKNNEGAVRFETLEESVQKMVPKLREKYGDKKVDFDVVVQNGRVGLKPKVGE